VIRRLGRLLVRLRLPALLALLAVSGAGAAQTWGQDGLSDIVIDDSRITESSGLAVSPTEHDLLYTVNDSGHDAVVYVIDRTTGDVAGTTTLVGVDTDTDDLEALAVGDNEVLWVADTGDNGADRSDTALYALPAPGRGADAVTPRRYPLTYADGATDVEALLVDPARGDGWLVTKGVFGSQVLRLPARRSPRQPITPEPVPGVDPPVLVTDGVVLPGGDAAVLRTYTAAFVYRLPDWELIESFALPRQEQGESVTALSPGLLLAGSEGTPALIDEVPVPARVGRALARDEPRVRIPRGREVGLPDPADDDQPFVLIAVLVGSAVLTLSAALLLLRRRRLGR